MIYDYFYVCDKCVKQRYITDAVEYTEDYQRVCDYCGAHSNDTECMYYLVGYEGE